MARALIFVVLVALVAVVVAVSDAPLSEVFAAPEEHFKLFMSDYGKSYEGEEYRRRFSIFQDNIKRAALLQSENPDAVFGVTKFSDLSQEEFAGMYLGSNPALIDLAEPAVEVDDEDLYVPPVAGAGAIDPTNYDWRNHSGVISPVKNQAQCGSCWAFSATETIESYWALAGHSLAILSPEQIVDCDTTCGGCNGGWPYLAYEYVHNAGGIETESAYPYIAGGGKSGTCKFSKGSAVATVASYTSLAKTEAALYKQLSTAGPVSVCVDAAAWSSYKSGVLTSCASSVDHCVQAVGYSGYGTSSSYWIVRNSWGADWGVAGYIHIKTGSNLCAIANYQTIVNI